MGFISSQHLDAIRTELLKRIELSEGRIGGIEEALKAAGIEEEEGEVRKKVKEVSGNG